MNRINKHAKVLRDAVDNGEDPMMAELNDTAAQGGKSKPTGNQQLRLDFIFVTFHTSTNIFSFQLSLTLEKPSVRPLVETAQ
jgi:hypothetical protein